MKPRTILYALRALNWAGHVELPDYDVEWLASALADHMNANDDAQLCGVCSQFKDITVETRLGRICEDCIDEAALTAKESREALED